MADVGPHLLGRIPSDEDDRDYKMRTLLDADSRPTELDLALDALLASHSSKSVKRWAQLVTARLQPVSPDPIPPIPPIPSPDPSPTENPWTTQVQLDQGETGHCVGFGWAQWGDTTPINDSYVDDDGHAIYYECKVIDGETGQENGSQVRSGAKAMKNRGRIDAYVFAENMDDIEEWVKTKGPVVVGTDWTNDMFEPDEKGFVRPTGGFAGGHCYLLVGWDDKDNLTFHNSWGISWGLNGFFYMKAADFATLLASEGEACAGLELPL
jgi:hypothetical protein